MTTRRQGPSILDALASLRPWSLGVVAVAVLAVASPLGAAVATPVLKWTGVRPKLASELEWMGLTPKVQLTKSIFSGSVS